MMGRGRERSAVMERMGSGPSALGASRGSQAEKQQGQIGQLGKSRNCLPSV